MIDINKFDDEIVLTVIGYTNATVTIKLSKEIAHELIVNLQKQLDADFLNETQKLINEVEAIHDSTKEFEKHWTNSSYNVRDIRDAIVLTQVNLARALQCLKMVVPLCKSLDTADNQKEISEEAICHEGCSGDAGEGSQ